MDFKIKITCKKCDCHFQLRPIDFKEPRELRCPNCGQQVPTEIVEKLTVGVKALGEIPEVYPEGASAFSLDSKPKFWFRVVEYDPVIKKEN